MRMNSEPTFVETSNVGETKRATIQTSSKIFNFFSKQIYSDFYTAVWRELVANAIDAQKSSGITTPPVVTAPSILEPYAKVRDFGCSMDHDFMMNHFMAFGDASTKDDSDDFIGGFGIGSKAPLAYTDQYSIRCYLDGVVRVYSIFKDDEDCPSIAFLSEDATDEPNGVEVGFPVRQDDIEKFTKTLVKTLRYFRPLPILEGTELELNEVKYDAKGTGWGIRSFEGDDDRAGRIIIGGVAYPLDRNLISFKYPNLRGFANYGLDLFLNIGEANIALSREHVTHDDELLERLEAIIGNIGPEYGAQISKKFEQSTTLWGAKKLLGDLIEEADREMIPILKKHAMWKGKPITHTISAPSLSLLYVAYGSYGYAYNSRSTGAYSIPTTEAISPRFRAWVDHARFEPHTFDRIVWDDTPDKPSLRIRTLIEENPDDRILIVRNNAPDDEDDVTMQQFLDSLGNPPAAMVTVLSAYKPKKIVRAAAGTATRPFKCYVRENRPSSYSNEQSSLPADGGLYVVMNNFAPESSADDVNIAQQSMPKNTVWLNLTDFRASGVKDKPNWYSVEEGIAKVKSSYRKQFKNLPEAQGWYEAFYKLDDPFVRKIAKLAELPNFPKQGPLLQILRLHQKHEEVTTSAHSATRTRLLKVDGSTHFEKIKKLAGEAAAKHPLLHELMNDHTMSHRASDELKNRLF